MKLMMGSEVCLEIYVLMDLALASMNEIIKMAQPDILL